MANKLWENGDGALVRLDRKATEERGGGLARIGVLAEVAPHDWEAFTKLSGASTKTVGGLRKAAIKQGSRVGEWYCSFEAVHRAQWHAVEVFHEGEWQGVEFEASPDTGGH